MRDIKTREGFEFWDKLNALPRYAFLLSPSGTSVQKFEDKAMGNWIDVHEAQSVIDQAQERITELITSYKALGELYAGTQKGFERMQAERDALQLRLNAAEQRIDDLAAAAEPFAKVADLYAGEEDDSHEPARDVGMHDDLRLTLGHFRALNDLCTKPLIKS